MRRREVRHNTLYCGLCLPPLPRHDHSSRRDVRWGLRFRSGWAAPPASHHRLLAGARWCMAGSWMHWPAAGRL
eukprot:5183710-Pyramimonas_sp.AAC.1